LGAHNRTEVAAIIQAAACIDPRTLAEIEPA
jgi:hypothetical protein